MPDEFFEAKKSKDFVEVGKIRDKYSEEVKNKVAREALRNMDSVKLSKKQGTILIHSDSSEPEDGEICEKTGNPEITPHQEQCLKSRPFNSGPGRLDPKFLWTGPTGSKNWGKLG